MAVTWTTKFRSEVATVLVTGAYGFLGLHIVSRLAEAGHQVVGCGRDVAFGRRVLPDIRWIPCDFNQDTDVVAWLPRLDGVDAVVNCVGILQSDRRDRAGHIHADAPRALFAACERAGVRRVVQISALGAADDANTDYARSKAAGDAVLAAMDLDWVILRPSLVYTRSVYGGTALMRGLAGFPFVVPVFDGSQEFQPVHMKDLTAVVARFLEPDAPSQVIVPVVGPEKLKLDEILAGWRRWLGFGPPRFIRVPRWTVWAMAGTADLAGWLGSRTALRSTSFKHLERSNTEDPALMTRLTGIAPRRFTDALAAEPAGVQDRWHARLYFLKPALRVVLALFWVATGILSVTPAGRALGARLLEPAGWPGPWIESAIVAAGVVDAVLGLALLLRVRVRLTVGLQIGLTLAYLAVLSWAASELWLDPLGPLIKVLPILALSLAVLAIERER